MLIICLFAGVYILTGGILLDDCKHKADADLNEFEAAVIVRASRLGLSYWHSHPSALLGELLLFNSRLAQLCQKCTSFVLIPAISSSLYSQQDWNVKHSDMHVHQLRQTQKIGLQKQLNWTTFRRECQLTISAVHLACTEEIPDNLRPVQLMRTRPLFVLQEGRVSLLCNTRIFSWWQTAAWHHPYSMPRGS